jgi:heat shock protein HtpX
MDRISFYDQESRNKRDSILLILALFIIVGAVVYVLGEIYSPGAGIVFLIIAIILAVPYTLFSFYMGDRVVLASVHAKPVDPDADHQSKYLTNVVEEMAIAAGLPTPKIYIMDSPEMNAFATGKDPQHASITVTSALLQNLNRGELEGVIGHEMSHVRNYDIRFSTFAAVLVGIVAIIAQTYLRGMLWGAVPTNRNNRQGNLGLLIIIGIFVSIFAWLASKIVQAMISRRREYLADASSAELTRNPEELASALEKISGVNQGKMPVSDAIAPLFIVDPIKGPLERIFDTHPDINDRIRILRNM